MPLSDLSLLTGQYRGSWIRLRTLVMLRWAALVGQLTAIVVGNYLFDLDLPLGWCLMAIGASTIWNIAATSMFPESARLDEKQNLAMILFDLLQLCFLLFLTGGLHNPFAILVLGPVVVSASVLSLRSVLFVAGSALILVALLAFYYVPLRTGMGYTLGLPRLFLMGNWVAVSVAILFLATYTRRIVSEINSMSDALTATQLALAREQKLTDIGGVVAAAAHELGTPLATITLTSSELAEELADRPDLQEDAQLIRTQADRCRDILRTMGQAGQDDAHMRQVPLSQVILEAAEPHRDRGIPIDMEFYPDPGVEPHEPVVQRRPEIIHGLRNLIQNAVDFAQTAVRVTATWNQGRINVQIQDDGRGFEPAVLGRIGDPFVRRRRTQATQAQRQEYEGMGLGLFIAKTLLQRTGAELTFANLDPSENGTHGALVHVSWPRSRIEATPAGNIEDREGRQNIVA